MKKSAVLQKIIRTAGRTINRNRLISADEKVLVALSGGIDSLVLLDILHERKKHIPINYELFAVHIHMQDVTRDNGPGPLKEFCSERSIVYKEIQAVLDYTQGDNSIFICNSCSRLRRKLIFDYAEQMGCTKIAFGHHMDDALETLFLNMTYSSTISSMPAALSIFEEKLTLIRPLLNCTREDILQYGEIKDIVPLAKKCPHETTSKRDTMRTILFQLHKGDQVLKKNLFHSMSNIHTAYLP